MQGKERELPGKSECGRHVRPTELFVLQTAQRFGPKHVMVNSGETHHYLSESVAWQGDGVSALELRHHRDDYGFFNRTVLSENELRHSLVRNTLPSAPTDMTASGA